jgi:hypothetical protein
MLSSEFVESNFFFGVMVAAFSIWNLLLFQEDRVFSLFAKAFFISSGSLCFLFFGCVFVCYLWVTLIFTT